MSYKCETVISVDSSNEVPKVTIKTWKGYFQEFNSLNPVLVQDTRTSSDKIEEVKKNPWGPKLWPIQGATAHTLNSDVLPMQYEKNARMGWESFAFAAAQVAENYHRQMEICPIMVDSILSNFLSVEFTVTATLEDWKELYKTTKIPDIDEICKSVFTQLEKNNV